MVVTAIRKASRKAGGGTNAVAAIAIAMLVAFASPTAAQNTRIMVRATGNGRAADADALAAALARSPILDAILVAPADVNLAEAASRASCGLAVDTASETLESGDATSAWRVIDPLTGAVVAEGIVEGPEPTERDLAEFWWLPVVEATEAAMPAATRSLVMVKAKPGTTIVGLGTGILTMPASGTAEIELRVPGTYRWRAVSEGAYPERGTLNALERGAILSIPRRPLGVWTIESGLFMAQFPDLWASRRFADDYVFVKAGITQFFLGLYLADEEYGEPTPSAIISVPLAQPGIGGGVYILPPDAVIRPYATAQVFARLMVAPGVAFGLDPIAAFGTSAAIGAEWRVAMRVAVFMELGASWYPIADGALMAAAGISSSGKDPLGYFYGDSWFVELPLFRLGARLTL